MKLSMPAQRGRRLLGYHGFEAKNRPEGWNAWVTLAIPLGSAGK